MHPSLKIVAARDGVCTLASMPPRGPRRANGHREGPNAGGWTAVLEDLKQLLETAPRSGTRTGA